MNDTERELYVENDEYLWDCFQASKHRTTNAYVRTHRAKIDAYLAPMLAGRQHAHYGKYQRPKW